VCRDHLLEIFLRWSVNAANVFLYVLAYEIDCLTESFEFSLNIICTYGWRHGCKREWLFDPSDSEGST
jgi:hypothetical protein